MSRKKLVALIVCLFFTLGLWPAPALAKGFSGGRASFSGGGRSFSVRSSGFASSKSFSSPGSSSKVSIPAAPAPSSSKGFTPPSAPSSSSGKGFTSGGRSFSTPRQTTPPSLTGDYQTGRKAFASQRSSYTTSRPSYTGTWDRTTAAAQDKYPRRPTVEVYGSPPQPPYYYHNYYWGLPWWQHLLFGPQYYYAPWGYHYYVPRFLTWFLLLALLGLGGFLLFRILRRR
ncbi:MAG: hypothetical protein PWP41_1788 [Moorella sp. (in: firmicutes)]|uniref:Uncharacterized protein n=1 Tax=Neomoorella thermoacetica TaxID=1525 RepID=A0A1J5NSU3_NEOTH|nr:hypothetical protein [Moorella sp. (in: firmicutes)]OIQ58364.1 hypothetical protein MOTE_20270 [Moorella thermoacetica]